MNWFLIALGGPLLWSFSNHIDKFLLEKHLKGVGKEALVLYSTIFGLLMLPIAYVIDNNVFSIEISAVAILVLAGIFSALALFLYLAALEDYEASVVVPFMQLIPVFGFFIGFILLGETLTPQQILGSLIIIVGALILSVEINELRHVKVRTRMVVLMTLSALCFAIYEGLFKFIAIENSFWVSSFWQYVGLFMFGIVLFSISANYRNDFVFLIKKHNWYLFSVNVFNEIIYLIGNTFYNFALLLAPLALVMTANGYQPVFVFIQGLILTYLFPKFVKENTSMVHLIHKSLSILVVLVGTLILYN